MTSQSILRSPKIYYVQRITLKGWKSLSQELILCACDHWSPEERNKIKVFTSVAFTSVIGLFFVAFAHFLDYMFLSPILTALLFRSWLQNCWAYPKRCAGASRRLVQLSETVMSDCWAWLGVVNLPNKWTRVESWVNNCLTQYCHHKWDCPRMKFERWRKSTAWV